VVQIARSLNPESGGTSESIPALARATAATGRYTNHLLHFGDPLGSIPIACANVPLRTLEYHPLSLLAAPASILREEVRDFDIAHLHGLWEPQCSAAGRLCRSLGIPYVVSAHGMLERWAIRNKALKKALYGALVERRNLRGAACMRALTGAELEDYRRYGFTGPVAIVPNGVAPQPPVSERLFLNHFPQLVGQKIVLFLGRIHYKKGVHMLCRAWANISRQFPGAHLVLAGPDYENTLAPLQALVSELNIGDRITFTGMLAGDLKWSALKAAGLFVLPSFSEGFSVAILEALAAGLPVIATHPCNFPDLTTSGAGLIIRPDQPELERGLSDLLTLSSADSQAMGRKGVELVAGHYSWQAIGEDMAAVYDWLLGGAMPTGVEIDPGSPRHG